MFWFTCKIVTPSGRVSAHASVKAKSERAALMWMRKHFYFTGNDHCFVTEANPLA